MGSFEQHDLPKKIGRVDLDVVLDKAQTGDLVLFCGIGFDSTIIRLVSHDKNLSHVGIFVRNPITDELYILEANRGLEPFDMYTHTFKDGVRLSDAREKIEEYVGYCILWRRLKIPDEIRFDTDWQSKVMDFIEKVHDEDYTKSVVELVRSVKGTNITLNHGYFCTKLVARFYISMGIITREKLENNYALWQFTSSYKLPYTSKKYRLRHEKRIIRKPNKIKKEEEEKGEENDKE